MDKGITFTHLISAWGALAGIGAFLFGYIVLKVKTMISDSEKAMTKVIEGKIERVTNEQDDKHTTIMLKLDELVKGMNKIDIKFVRIEERSHNQRNTDSE